MAIRKEARVDREWGKIAHKRIGTDLFFNNQDAGDPGIIQENGASIPGIRSSLEGMDGSSEPGRIF